MLTGQLLATGPVYLSLFLPLSPSTLSVLCVCALVLRIVYLVLLCCIKLMLLTIISIMTTLFSLQTKVFFPPLLLDCRKMLSLFSFVLLTSREITICLIVGDTHTPQELGALRSSVTQVYLPFSCLFISQQLFLYFPHPFHLSPPLHLLL